ncbi:serine hydrolase domain-containing protein [Stakelama marina]|uniref:Beta-lactamase family protein n=1 Tax=Stakelama marina TaxID=2826939 RepID=A0A8T4IA59_9SPHN|nr:serine hydrolase domain-containing protein [Stakelama marina]MBR0551908.1 beta-lactamase family protein [Stakelama marina]
MRLMLILFGFLLVPASQASMADRSIDAFIERELPSSGAPGVAYAIVDGGAFRSGGRGTILADSGQSITPDTPFLIGSISKSFTAVAVMQLVEAGKIRLDASIATYLRAFQGRPSGAITIRQLLSHTSGFSTVQGNRAHMDTSLSEGSLGDYASRVAKWEPVHPPGSRWEYSNTNYQILGALIEATSGQRYPDYVQAHILAPIGMKNSFVSDGQTPGKVAVGHRPWFGGKRAYEMRRTNRVSAPAGGIFASADDLALYLAMMLNGKDDIISAASKAAMLRPASETSPFYGFGWFLDSRTGTAYHDGLVPGTETLATLLPSQGKAVVVLVNANSGIGFGETLKLREGITAKALGLDYAGHGSRLVPKMTYLLVMLLPLFFLASIVWAWWHREKLRTKSGAAGMFSLWFPLVAMLAVAGLLTVVIPAMFGGSIRTLLLFQPDFAGAMVAAAVMGPIWAIVRLALAYSRRANPV